MSIAPINAFDVNTIYHKTTSFNGYMGKVQFRK